MTISNSGVLMADSVSPGRGLLTVDRTRPLLSAVRTRNRPRCRRSDRSRRPL